MLYSLIDNGYALIGAASGMASSEIFDEAVLTVQTDAF